ncbi:MAG: arginine--tRNA ligase [Clostridiaceae bacterium]|nr:arginine--tRNA ligase [Clostridiaceae bacterium]
MDYKQNLAEFLTKVTNLPVSNIYNLIEIPPQENLGDYSFPCFQLAKEFKKNPAEIAKEIKEELSDNKPDWLDEIKVAGPYLNFYLEPGFFAENLLKEILLKKETFGHKEIGEGKNVIVEYSSPNIAKPFHVGHAFTTILGQAISNIYEALGYNIIRMNHLGDYGTQFGKLIVAWRLWGDETELAKDPITELTRVYVKFHDELEKEPELEDEAREAFRKLEAKETAEVELWQKFRQVSLVEFNRLYDRLGIKFDNYNGESFYSDMIPEVVSLLEEKNLLEESEGAQLVDLSEFNLNPCIILKSDGTTIYASRDLAAILYRNQEYDYHKNIYVVGLPQTNHFQQVFAVLKKANFSKADQNVHVGFGTVKFKEGEFSTRKGNIILLEDLLNQSVDKTRKIIETNNPEMTKEIIAETAEKVGLAAVSYTYLRNSREKDIFFDWDEILDFEGDTAPYLMYTYARARSVLQKSNFSSIDISKIDFTLLNSEAEFSLLKELYKYPDAIESAAKEYEPSILLRNISQIARSFNRYYHNVPILKTDDNDLRSARLALLEAICIVIQNGLKLVGIETVERM